MDQPKKGQRFCAKGPAYVLITTHARLRAAHVLLELLCELVLLPPGVEAGEVVLPAPDHQDPHEPEQPDDGENDPRKSSKSAH